MLNEIQQKQIKELREKGNSITYISEILNQSKTSINNYLYKNHILHPNKLVNLIGQKFNRLEVIEKSKNKWKCKCDCGNIVVVPFYHLLSCNTQSCGCLHIENALKKLKDINDIPNIGNKNRGWKGHEDISATFWWSIKKDAKIRNLEFNITIEQIWNQFIKQNRKCALSGVQLNFPVNTRERKTGNASLDRIDSSKGYTSENIQWVHKDLNIMKRNFEEKRFFNWIKIIYEYKNL